VAPAGLATPASSAADAYQPARAMSAFRRMETSHSFKGFLSALISGRFLLVLTAPENIIFYGDFKRSTAKLLRFCSAAKSP
jgi:hypothetical protein